MGALRSTTQGMRDSLLRLEDGRPLFMMLQIGADHTVRCGFDPVFTSNVRAGPAHRKTPAGRVG